MHGLSDVTDNSDLAVRFLAHANITYRIVLDRAISDDCKWPSRSIIFSKCAFFRKALQLPTRFQL